MINVELKKANALLEFLKFAFTVSTSGPLLNETAA